MFPTGREQNLEIPSSRFHASRVASSLVRQALESGRHASLVIQTLRSGLLASLEMLQDASDVDLPPSLQGKGLILGRPIPIWPLGRSAARDGRVFIVDARAVEALLADGNSQEFVPATYSHEEDPNHGDDNAGYGLHFVADARFIYADKMAWTAQAAAKIAAGVRGPISPDAYCESLDPETLETLTPESPLYDPATGGYRTNTFRPMQWRAFSLVGIPALKNLPAASLSAERTSIAPAAARKENNHMNPKLAKLLGLPVDATDAQKTQALSAFKQKLGLSETATESEVLAAAGTFDKPGILSLIRGTFKIPEVVKDDLLSKMLDDALGGGESEGIETPAAEAAPAASAPSPAMMASAAAAAIKPLIPKITSDATETVRQELAAKQKGDTIDRELLEAEKAGRLVPAEREEFRIRLSDEKLAAGARRELAARSGGARVPDGEVIGGSLDPSVSVDDLPPAQQRELLSRASAWSMQTGSEFSVALHAVRGGDSRERAFHAQVLACNPNWPNPTKNGSSSKWPTGLRPGLRSIELDTDMLEHIGKQMQAGAIAANIISPQVQAAALRRMKLAGELSSFQPATKDTLPFMFGYIQGEFGGSEIAMEITGAASNEEASYPVAGTEALYVQVNASGLPEPVGLRAKDVEESYLAFDWKKVTLKGYSNKVVVDRRSQNAGGSVLPIGLMATATEQALTRERMKKELNQSAHLRNTANYDSTCQKPLTGTRQWSYKDSTPVEDLAGVDTVLWRHTGVSNADTVKLIPPDVIGYLRIHPQFLKAAQNAGVGQLGRPMTMAPIEMLVALLGTIVTPTCRISTTPGGAGADTPWGQDVIVSVVSRGKVIAPRGFVTVVSAGFPVVYTEALDGDALIGADVVKVSEMYAVETVGLTSVPTKSAFIFTTATPELTVAA